MSTKRRKSIWCGARRRSYLIDGERNLAGMAQGPRDWDSEAAKRLIQHYLRQ